MLSNVYSFIWTTLYFVYCVVIFIERVWLSLQKRCTELLCKDSVKDELEFISKQMKLFHKIPSHVVIVLGNESISYKDLANITVWCIAAGISFISLYDYDGVLKKNEAELFKVLSAMNKGHLENINWGKKSLTNGVLSKNGKKNGTAKSRKIQVNILSYTDGKESIVDITSSLCQSVLANEFSSTDITQELISKMLQADLDVPDPEVAICCGPMCCTYGLLPWQIRITEFLQLQTHHNVTARDFVNLLQTYGKCEQRFGK